MDLENDFSVRDEGFALPLSMEQNFDNTMAIEAERKETPQQNSAVGTRRIYDSTVQSILAKYLHPEELLEIQRICDFAERYDPAAEFFAPMRDIAIILGEMRVDSMGISCGVLQYIAIDPIENTIKESVKKQIEEDFDVEYILLLEGIAYFNAIQNRKGKNVQSKPTKNDKEQVARKTLKRRQAQSHMLQIETIRKMFIAMGNDPRIVIFKIAEQVLRMRKIRLNDPDARLIASETRDIYVPLVSRLGISHFETELEDRAFEILEPDEYRKVTNLVSQFIVEQHGYIDRVCAILQKEAEKSDIITHVSGRYKHYYSIYRKLLRNDWNIRQVYDLLAFRVIIDPYDKTLEDTLTAPEKIDLEKKAVNNCYAMLGFIHAMWVPKEDRIKDYVAMPKPNGYQSLHTTVFCEQNQLVEIQIRTRKMHEDAEFGFAMHWHYKAVGDSAAPDKKLHSWLDQLHNWQSELDQRAKPEKEVSASADSSNDFTRVFIFSPRGDVFDFQNGATPVDFAYRIHTNLGDHCAGAKIISTVSGAPLKLVPLDYKFKNGQIVEIMTRKDAHPTRDWLHFTVTPSARSHINRYLKQQERDINITIGREKLEIEAKFRSLGSLAEIGDQVLREVAESYNFTSIEDMFEGIITKSVSLSGITQKIQNLLNLAEPLKKIPTPDVVSTKVTRGGELVVSVGNQGGLLARLANCCHPLPEDPIVGFISRGKGIVIHHSLCKGLRRLKDSDQKRIIELDWGKNEIHHFDAVMMILSEDRTGLLRDVTQEVRDMKINMGATSSSVNRKNNVSTILLTLQIESVKQFYDAMNRIRNIPGVLEVKRDERSLIAS